MRYHYLPRSAIADEAARAAAASPPAAPPGWAILRAAQPYDLATPGTPRGILDLARAAEAGGGWRHGATLALAMSADGAQVVASLCLRLVGDVPPPPLKGSFSCRRCRRWLEGDWSAADPAARVEIERQMATGRCDACAARESGRRRAWASYVRVTDAEGGISWKPGGAQLLDTTRPERTLLTIGLLELRAVLLGVPYIPPPPRPGPPRLACPRCDKVTPFSTSTWRPYTRHRCETAAESRR